jgi:hypothetical protein
MTVTSLQKTLTPEWLSLVLWTELKWAHSELNRSSVQLVHFAADGQSDSSSWYWTPLWSPSPDLYYCPKFEVFIFFCALLKAGRVCNEFGQLLLCFASAITAGSSPTESVAVPLYVTWYSANLEDSVPLLISPRNTVHQWHPQVLGSAFGASLCSQR